jgi:monofunctional biosynthetic peptidoglycan transglycosylase
MLRRQAKIISLMGKIFQIDMGYKVEDGKLPTKTRKKWRASVTQIGVI